MPRSTRMKREYTSARERAEKQGTGFTAPYLQLPKGVQLFKPKQGVMLLDILPYEVGENNPWADEGNIHWERTYWVHRGIGANSDSFLCPRKTSKSPCPVCEARAKLMAKSDEDNEDLIQDLAPKQRQLFNVVNVKDPDKGVQLWDISYHLFGKVLDARVRDSDVEDRWEDFFHLEDGLTLKIGFVDDSYAGRSFVKAETIDFKPRREPYEDDMLKEATCLDEILIEPEYADLKKTFLQTIDKSVKEEEPDEEEAPRGKKRKSRDEEEEPEEPRSRKSRKALGEEEGEEDFRPVKKRKSREEEEPEEDPAPRKRKARDEEEELDEEEAPRGKKKADEDPWDDFDEEPAPKKRKSREEEEPDEEEAPRGKKRKSRDEEEEPDEEEEKPRVRSADEESPRGKKKPRKDDWD